MPVQGVHRIDGVELIFEMGRGLPRYPHTHTAPVDPVHALRSEIKAGKNRAEQTASDATDKLDAVVKVIETKDKRIKDLENALRITRRLVRSDGEVHSIIDAALKS